MKIYKYKNIDDLENRLLNHNIKIEEIKLRGAQIRYINGKSEVKKSMEESKKMLLEPGRLEHETRRNILRAQKRAPRKDNQKDFNYGYHPDHRGKIRVPRLSRKTAWKRFYKLYPDLKGLDSISGFSQSREGSLRRSFIKLKKS